jgi:DNA-binding HxlR family transcriptional regulator
MSSSVLYDRLRDLTEAGLVERSHGDLYVLTEMGARLGTALKPLGAWAELWAASLHQRSTVSPISDNA